MAIAVIAPTVSRGLDRMAATSPATRGSRLPGGAAEAGSWGGPGGKDGRGPAGAVTGVSASASEVTMT